MNNNLLNIIKDIAAKYGDTVLSEPRRVSALLADLARDEPKAQKHTFVKCLEHGFAGILRSVPESERDNCMRQLAQKLYDEEGLDLGLCGETLDLLAAVLFGEEQKQKKNLCKNCGNEIQEGWQACPFCRTPVEGQEISPVVSSVSGSGGYGVGSISPEPVKPELPKPEPAASTSTPSAKTVDQTAGCNGCGDNKKETCNFYGCGILEASGYDCGMKINDPDAEKLRKNRKTKNILSWVFYILLGFSLAPFTYGASIAIILGVAVILESVNAGIKKKRYKNAKRLSGGTGEQ